jgi:hypothetical protein
MTAPRAAGLVVNDGAMRTPPPTAGVRLAVGVGATGKVGVGVSKPSPVGRGIAEGVSEAGGAAVEIAVGVGVVGDNSAAVGRTPFESITLEKTAAATTAPMSLTNLSLDPPKWCRSL